MNPREELVNLAVEAAVDIAVCIEPMGDALASLELLAEEGVWLDGETRKVLAIIGELSDRCLDLARSMQIINKQITMNSAYGKGIWTRHVGGEEIKEPDDYETKKLAVSQFNAELREIDAAIVHPKTGEPCILYAVWNIKGNGRYTLEGRTSKQRTGSWQTIKELVPFKLVADVPRKEGTLERKKEPQ